MSKVCFGGILGSLVLLGLLLGDPLRERLACFLHKRKVFCASPGLTLKKYERVLDAYWEQGWEGRIEYALAVEGLDRPFFFLENGQRLTLYAEDGSVLWSGVLCFVRRRWWDRRRPPSGVWSEVKPVGVSYARWMEWFAHQPPLRAPVEVEAPQKDSFLSTQSMYN